MISVVIPTSDSARTLVSTLSSLVPGAVHGLVREVVVVDAGSTDDTLAIAEDGGARVVAGGPGLSERLSAGCAAAKGPWLLVLTPRTRLGPEWEGAARAHMDDHAGKAGYLRLALDDHRARARLAEMARSLGAALDAPCGDHGLLISKKLYDALGGFAGEAADPVRALARRIGGGRLRPLGARIFVASPGDEDQA